MNLDPLSEFGELVIREIRDQTIEHWTSAALGKMKDEDSQMVMSVATGAGLSAEQFTQTILPAIVDTCLFNVLGVIERQQQLQLSYRTKAGEVIEPSKLSDGLTGELYGRRGWISTFSRFKRQA
jgi:hypothetical protein